MATITITARDQVGAMAKSTVEYVIQDTLRVAGGVYFGGNADIRNRTTDRSPSMRIGGIQQYRSFADGMLYPGYQKAWISSMVDSGVWLNLVTELKHYGSPTGTQTIMVEGRHYIVPAPVGTVQRRPGTTFPVAYSYEQVLNGDCDGLIHRLLAQLRAVPAGGRVNIQLASEVDTDNEFGTSHGSSFYNREESDMLAVKAYEYIADWLRTPPSEIQGIDRGITLSLGYAGQWSGITGFVRTHPESLMSKMDYLHMNSYNRRGNWTPERRFREIIAWQSSLGPIGRAKDIIVSEFGSPAANIPNQAAFIRGMPAAITKINQEQYEAQQGRFVMTLWFSSRDPSWGVLSPEEDGLVALTEMMDTPPYS
jgi:hypothetical protein